VRLLKNLNDLTSDLLVSLKIEDAPLLDDISNLSNCPNLNKITLNYCKLFSDISVLKNVKSVDIQSCLSVRNLLPLSGKRQSIGYPNSIVLDSVSGLNQVSSLRLMVDFLKM
jgi:Leucine-rich repeat (LRR) protein